MGLEAFSITGELFMFMTYKRGYVIAGKAKQFQIFKFLPKFIKIARFSQSSQQIW